MRAYRVRQRERNARLVDPADAPESRVANIELRERIDQLTDERDRLWAQIVRLQQHSDNSSEPATESPQSPLRAISH